VSHSIAFLREASEVVGLQETVSLPSVGCRLSLDAVYEGVEFL